MGKKLAKPNGQTGVQQRAGQEGQGGQPEPGRYASDPGTETTGTEGIRVIGGGSAGAAEETRLPGLADLKEDKIPTPRKRPPRKGTTTGKKADGQMTADMLASLLGVVFNLLAMRLGQHWALRQDEAQALAEPITRIMARYDLTKKTGQYADFIALGVAAAGIMMPKVMIELSKPKKEKPSKGAIQNVASIQQQGRQPSTAGDSNTQTGAADSPSKPSNGTATANGEGHDSRRHLVGLIAPI